MDWFTKDRWEAHEQKVDEIHRAVNGPAGQPEKGLLMRMREVEGFTGKAKWIVGGFVSFIVLAIGDFVRSLFIKNS